MGDRSRGAVAADRAVRLLPEDTRRPRRLSLQPEGAMAQVRVRGLLRRIRRLHETRLRRHRLAPEGLGPGNKQSGGIPKWQNSIGMTAAWSWLWARVPAAEHWATSLRRRAAESSCSKPVRALRTMISSTMNGRALLSSHGRTCAPHPEAGVWPRTLPIFRPGSSRRWAARRPTGP